MSPRLEALKSRHARLESKIRDELLRPGPDSLHLTMLKRRKLLLRDQIAGLEATLPAKR